MLDDAAMPDDGDAAGMPIPGSEAKPGGNSGGSDPEAKPRKGD